MEEHERAPWSAEGSYGAGERSWYGTESPKEKVGEVLL